MLPYAVSVCGAQLWNLVRVQTASHRTTNERTEEKIEWRLLEKNGRAAFARRNKSLMFISLSRCFVFAILFLFLFFFCIRFCSFPIWATADRNGACQCLAIDADGALLTVVLRCRFETKNFRCTVVDPTIFIVRVLVWFRLLMSW